MSNIRYTHHAKIKFEMLERHGFGVTPAQVEETVLNPDRGIPQPHDQFVAQRGLTERHVLRVICRHESDAIVLITFYPGRRKRYEA